VEKKEEGTAQKKAAMLRGGKEVLGSKKRGRILSAPEGRKRKGDSSKKSKKGHFSPRKTEKRRPWCDCGSKEKKGAVRTAAGGKKIKKKKKIKQKKKKKKNPPKKKTPPNQKKKKEKKKKKTL